MRQATAGWERGYWVLEMGCGNGSFLSLLEDGCNDGRVVGCRTLCRESMAPVRRDSGSSGLPQDGMANHLLDNRVLFIEAAIVAFHGQRG